MHPIHVDIWSDFVCPFCYIGKRNFEKALAAFPERERVTVTWKSFELDSREERDPSKNVYERLAAKYGMDLPSARQAVSRTVAMAKDAGLTFDMDRLVPANTFNAHRLSQLAARAGAGGGLAEKLMAAHFSEGKDIGDAAVLAAIAAEAGLPAGEVRKVLDGEAYADDVRRDEMEAWESGIRAVPFFLFNGEVAVRGAHASDAFLTALYSAPPADSPPSRTPA